MDGIDGIEMLNDTLSPKSKKKKKRSGSISSRKSSSSKKSMKSSKSKSSKRRLKKDKKSSSSELKIEDNVSVISDDSLGSMTQDDMSLKSEKSGKSAKSNKSSKSTKSKSRRSDRKRSSSKTPKSPKSDRKRSSSKSPKSPKRSNSLGQLGSRKEKKREEKNKRSNSLSNMASKKEAKRSESNLSGSSKTSSKRRGSMGGMSEKKASRRGSMGSKSGHSRSKHKRRGSVSSSHSRFSTDDESLGFNPNVAKIDENGEYTKDLELSESQNKKSSRQTRHNSSNTDSTASSTSGGSGGAAAIPTQVEIGSASPTPESKGGKRPPRESIMGYFPEEDEQPMDEQELVKYMEERSKTLDANKDANLALTKDADERVDLKAEAALILASANGPAYVEDVYLTVNGQKGELVPVNSLQWYMFRYAELYADALDVYEEPREDEDGVSVELPAELPELPELPAGDDEYDV